MKFGWLVFLILLSADLFAHAPGPYFGVSFGQTDVRAAVRPLRSDPLAGGGVGGGKVTFGGKSLKISGNRGNLGGSFDGTTQLKQGDQRDVGFNVLMGYQLFENFAFEFRYNKFGDAQYQDFSGNKAFNKEYSLDVVGKGTVPFATNWNLQGSIGVTWLHSSLTIDGSILSPPNPVLTRFNIADQIKDNSIDGVSGMIEIGLAYHWNPLTDVVINHTRFHGQKEISDASYNQLGVVYHFKDLMG